MPAKGRASGATDDGSLDGLAKVVTEMTGSAVTYGGVLYSEGGAVRLVAGLKVSMSFSCIAKGLKQKFGQQIIIDLGADTLTTCTCHRRMSELAPSLQALCHA